MTAAATTTEAATAPGPLTQAITRLGRNLGMNLQAATKGDGIALILDGAPVMITGKTRDEAVLCAAAFLNKVSAAVEHRERTRHQVAPHPSLTAAPMPEKKPAVAPRVRTIG